MLKLNIKNPKIFKAHRSGWGYVINKLMKYQHSSGILFDDFLDITFGYSRLQNGESGRIPYTKPWIGVLHHPPKICPWYSLTYKENIDIHNILNSNEFLISLEKCEAIIVLSNYLNKYLRKNFKQLNNIPIVTIQHPTEPGELSWDFNKFKKSSSLYGLKVLSIGYFLRNMTSIYLLNSNRKLDKYLMPSDIRYGLHNLSQEFIYKNLTHIDKNSIKILRWQPNNFYDKLLEQSLVFLDLYDTSCNNAIIESMIRSTPLLINRHEAIEEYLGSDYPLFYDSIDEAKTMITYDHIYDAHSYLKNQQYDFLNGEYFLQNFELQLNSILSNSTIKSNKNKIKISKPTIMTQPTIFQHLDGWPLITKELSKKYPYDVKTKNLNRSSIFLNNFLEHTFKHDTKKSKAVIIDKDRILCTRGYNLFAANNTDVLYYNNTYYEWRNSSWIQTNNNIVKNICEFNKILNFKQNAWVGILHNPIKMPFWFDYSQNIQSIIENQHFIDSLQQCKLLITLSQHLKTQLSNIFKKYNIPIISLTHPVAKHKTQFNFDKFQNNKRIIQIGYWLRNMHHIWNIKTDMDKWWLYGDTFASSMFDAESRYSSDNYKDIINETEHQQILDCINNKQIQTIKNVTVARLPRIAYNDMLASSVVVLNMYDTAANNAVLECIAKATPIIVNKLPATVEYLGKDYPLYYDNHKDIHSVCQNDNLIKDAHLYLKELNKDNKFSIDVFLDTLNTEIVKYAKNY